MSTSTAETSKGQTERARSPGFTIIELVVVLALVGLIAALVFPRLGLIGMGSVRTEARKLQGMVTLCFNLAVMEKVNYRIAFDLDNQCVWAEKREGMEYKDASTDLLRKHCLPESVLVRELEVPGRQLEGGGIEYIYFSPYGFVEPARIFVGNEANEGYSLFTDPVTGRTRVLEGPAGYQDLER